jgi:hypothetical protein
MKEFTVKLCQMAAAAKSDIVGGKLGHMHLILKKMEYRIATKNTTATVGLLKKSPDINPQFHLLKKDKLTENKVLGPD